MLHTVMRETVTQAQVRGGGGEPVRLRKEEMAQMPQPEPVLPPAGQLCPCGRLNLVTSALYHLSLSLEPGDQHRMFSGREGARRSCREYAGIAL